MDDAADPPVKPFSGTRPLVDKWRRVLHARAEKWGGRTAALYFKARSRAAAALGALLKAAGRDRDNFIYWTEDLERIIRSHKAKLPAFERLLGLLELRPGMTILDVGAGTGQMSCMMAERLAGTGRVYATDMNPRFVKYIANQARRKGLDNLRAVLVRGNQLRGSGLDDFYGRHTYDLILLHDVTPYIFDRLGFYRRLSGFLAPRGRIVVVQTDVGFIPFTREDFTDWDGFVLELRREPLETPVGWLLRRPLETMLDEYPGGDAGRLERAALFQLNWLLDWPFYLAFLDGLELKKGLAFTPEEKVYAEWGLSRMSLGGLAHERNMGGIAFREFRIMQRLNKLLLIQRFRPYLLRRGSCPYESVAEDARWDRRMDVLRWELEAAGFEKKGELIPYQGTWIATREDALAAADREPPPHPFEILRYKPRAGL